MPFVIHSPFDGTPVKIRDQDIGRAIRDKENRIFYVIPNSSGEGYYSAPTRQGGPKDEQRYARMMEKTAKTSQIVREEAATVQDATGRGRGKGLRKLVFLVVVIIVAVAAYYVWKNNPDKVKELLPVGDQPTSQLPGRHGSEPSIA